VGFAWFRASFQTVVTVRPPQTPAHGALSERKAGAEPGHTNVICFLNLVESIRVSQLTTPFLVLHKELSITGERGTAQAKVQRVSVRVELATAAATWRARYVGEVPSLRHIEKNECWLHQDSCNFILRVAHAELSAACQQLPSARRMGPCASRMNTQAVPEGTLLTQPC
jgi:hypothetical protein